MYNRLRRNRKNISIRSCLAETTISRADFIIPFFVKDKISAPEEIKHLPKNKIHNINSLVSDAIKFYQQGVGCFLLFPIIDTHFKDEKGSFALSDNNILFEAIRAIKKALPDATIMADVALDPYTSHGHDGIVNSKNEIDNDETVEMLVKLSLKLAEAGIDYVAPSDMMDGRVLMIRKALDFHHFLNVGIMSYSAKFASNLYGPFRDTVGSSLKFGDKKSYQLSYSNQKEALLEALEDEKEGADLLLVKPSTLYMDIISEISKNSLRPVGAYHVSGEYAMAALLAEKGMLNLEEYLLEVFTSLKRAGAKFIISYGYPLISHRIK